MAVRGPNASRGETDQLEGGFCVNAGAVWRALCYGHGSPALARLSQDPTSAQILEQAPACLRLPTSLRRSVGIQANPGGPGPSPVAPFAQQDPQLPQGFYPIQPQVTILPGDRLRATCEFNSSLEVRAGLRLPCVCIMGRRRRTGARAWQRPRAALVWVWLAAKAALLAGAGSRGLLKCSF